MTQNKTFQEFSFYEEIDSDLLEYLFESAWDTLQKKYPTATLDAADCFVIYAQINDVYSGNTFTSFSLGMVNNIPAIQNLKTKEVIKISLNKERWYQHYGSDEITLLASTYSGEV